MSPPPKPAPEPPTAPATILPRATPISPSPPSSVPVVLHRPTRLQHRPSQALPPMTTHWTRPLSCRWSYVVEGHQSRQPSKGAVAWLDLDPIPGASSLSCYPDGMFLGDRTGVFSPATCPDGWYTAKFLVGDEGVSVEPTTTAVCCSSYHTLEGSHCKRPVPTVLAVPISYDHGAETYKIMSNSTTTLYGATMAVSPIQALFMDKDMAMLGLEDEEDISHDEEGEPSLSTGARVGIALSVAAFVLLSLGVVFFCLSRWRRARRKQAKGLGVHELGGIVHERRTRSQESHVADDGRFDGHDRPVIEPPPAYEASVAASESPGQLRDEASARRDEIRALVAQKAAIQQRIDELERDSSESCPSDRGMNEREEVELRLG